MIRSYIRTHTKVSKCCDQGCVTSTGNIIGALVASEEDGNVYVSYSILHKKDMTDIQKKFGLSKDERILACQIALEKNEPIDLTKTALLHSSVKKMLPEFLKRCGACFLNAKTINGIDIKPFQHSYEDRMNACNTIVKRLTTMKEGFEKLITDFQHFSLDDKHDASLIMAKYAILLKNIPIMIDNTFCQPIDTIINSMRRYENKQLGLEIDDFVINRMKDYFKVRHCD